MFDRIEELERRYQELEALLSDPAVISNQPEFRKLSREHNDLSELVAAYRRWRKVLAEIEENRELLGDADMKEMAEEELKNLEAEREALEADIQVLLLPKDPNDNRSVILEIRAGTGGDESALFAGDLFRMYSRYADTNRWRVETISASESERGLQRDHRLCGRGGGLRQTEVRVRHPSRTACSRDRGPGTHPHQRLHRGDHGRGRGCRDRHQSG